MLASAILLALIAALVAWRYAPPAALPASAPAGEFSATRARAALARVLGDERPHPTGSPANAAVRERLLQELRAIGLEPWTETRFACGETRCATVSNVLAWVRGRDSAAPFVLVSVHHDSVAAGPGAADDGAGVASVLEVARALRASPPTRHDVLLLLDDGEEQALLGAEAFAADRARLARVGAVVNLEARGTTGPSLLFELSPGNRRLVEAAARALPRPATSSIYYEIYQRLPNDTDLTVFKRERLMGVNFAFVGGPLRYHTPRDDLAHLDLGTLQHQGEHALAMTRALAEAASWRAGDDAVFFDVLTLGVVRWPAPLTLWIAAAALLLVVLAGALSWRHAGVPGTIVASLVLVGSLIGAVALGVALRALLVATGGLPYVWVAHGAPLRAAFWAAGALAVALSAAVGGERLHPQGAWTATWSVIALLGVLVALAAAGIAYVLVVPALVAGLCGVAAALRRHGPAGWASLPPLLTSGVLVLPFAWLLFDGMGAPALPGIALLVALVLAGALPALAAVTRAARVGVAAVAAAVMAGGVVLALVAPPFTADAPQPVSLVLLHDADSRATRWVVSAGAPLPESMARAGRFAARTAPAYPWPSGDAWIAPGPQLQLAPPELEIQSITAHGDGLRVVARLRSVRHAPAAGLFLAGGRLRAATVEGVGLRVPPAHGDDLQSVEDVTLPSDGVRIELELAGTSPARGWIWDSQPGVDWAGSELLRARPASAVPLQRGDRSVVARAVTLTPRPAG